MTAPPSRAGACPHCATPTDDGDFCCLGCRAAATLLAEAGLDARYYAQRARPAPRPGGSAVPELAPRPLPGGECELRFGVDGLSCASCTWVAETLLARGDGVASAFVSYGTGQARVVYDPRRTSPAALLAPVLAVGWTVRPEGKAPAADTTLLPRLGVAAFGAMNVMLVSAGVYAGWLDGMSPTWQRLFAWWSLAIATPVATWCAWPFYRAALAAVRARRPHVDIPVSLGVVVMYAHGLWTVRAGGDAYLDSLTMLVALLLAARVVESRGRRAAAEAARSLGAMVPTRAQRLSATGVAEVPTADLRPGDQVVVAQGDEVPADGVVVSGTASAQLALLTGESAPRRVEPGSEVVAGALLVDGNLVVRVEAAGHETLLGRMAARLAEALDRPAPATLADRVAPWFTLGTLAVAGLTALGWGLARGPGEAVAATVSVLVVACPCALALASPLAHAAAIGGLARRGLLVRGPAALVALAEANTVVFDKTGTLTEGQPAVESADDDVLRVAAGLERQSRHPIARAIVAEAARRGIPLPSPARVVEVPGVGIHGEVDGRAYALGQCPDGVELRSDRGVVGQLRLADRPRPGAGAAVAALRALGLEVELLSGDDEAVARQVGHALDIVVSRGRADPEAKAGRVAELVAAGRRVVFVGDGINDGPALAAASVGVAMGSGAAASVQVADAVLVSGGLEGLVAGVRVARRARAVVATSSRRAIAYNVVAVTLAAAGLVNPLLAALSMPLSSLLVVWTARRAGESA